MATVAQLKAKLSTLDQIIVEARAERRKADEILASWENRQNRRSARQRQQLDDVARRMPSLKQGAYSDDSGHLFRLKADSRSD